MPRPQQIYKVTISVFGPNGWTIYSRLRKCVKSGEMAHILRASPVERAECTGYSDQDTRGDSRNG